MPPFIDLLEQRINFVSFIEDLSCYSSMCILPDIVHYLTDIVGCGRRCKLHFATIRNTFLLLHNSNQPVTTSTTVRMLKFYDLSRSNISCYGFLILERGGKQWLQRGKKEGRRGRTRELNGASYIDL